LLALGCVLALLALGGCGDDEKAPTQPPAGGETSVTRSHASSAPTSAPAPTAASTPATATANSSTSPEDQPGGPGDEVPIRVPATFTFARGGLEPPSVSVPAFLAVQLTVVSADGRAHSVRFEGPEPRTLSVPAGGSAGAHFDGFKAGTYALRSLDGNGGDGKLVVGGEPGP
jgi:hypothetical protein